MTTADGELDAPGWAAGAALPGDEAVIVPGRLLRRRLRASARPVWSARFRLADAYFWALAVAVTGGLATGVLHLAGRQLAGPGWAVPGAPGRLFALAAVLLTLGGLTRFCRAFGPVTVSSAFRFWLLSAPVRRRDLLRRRFVALLAVIGILTCVVVAPLALTASVAVLPAIAAAALAAIALTAASVWGQASHVADQVVHVVGHSLMAAAVLVFGSLATGIGRAGAESALRIAPGLAVAGVALLALVALGCGWRAYRALDRIDVSVLRRGQGLWVAGKAALVSLDAFLLADFAAEHRARSTGRVRSAAMGRNFAMALARSELARIRRRPWLVLRIAVAAVAWWGCRAVLPGPALAAAGIVAGYLLTLPLAGALRQLSSEPALRAQFAPADRWLGRASAAAFGLAAVIWTAVIIPGLPAGGGAFAAVAVPLGIAAAVGRTVTRPPLDYSKPPVPTPFGDLPLDLWRQLLRGPLLLALVTLVVLAR